MTEATDQDMERRATEIGWRPADQFKGDPANWVDATEYLRRGEEVLPLVKAENRRLQARQDEQATTIARLQAALAEQRQSMDDLAAHTAEQLKERLTEQKRELTAKLREARKDEDGALEGALEERLEENAAAQAKLKEKPVVKAPPVDQVPTETPEYRAWISDNPWFGGDSEADVAKTAAAQAFGVKAATAGKRGAAFFAAVDEALAKVYPPPKKVDRSEDGRPSGGGGGSSSGDNSFNALPSEAKAKAREQAARFVGPNKMFKDEKAWFSYYAKQYNTEAA